MRRNGHSIRIKAVILLAVLGVLGGCLFFMWNQRVTTVIVDGNEIYTDAEVAELIFETPLERNTVHCFLNNLFGETKDIPFVDHYEVRLVGLHTCEVMVYEKSIIGCFRYMGSYMYFDRDGIVVENSFEYLEGVPVVEGLDFQQVVLHEPLPVADETVFNSILNLTNLLKKDNINVDKMLYESDSDVVLYLGNVRVRLGDSSNLEEKIGVLSGMLSELEGLSGVLYLDSYDPGSSNNTFVFRQDNN